MNIISFFEKNGMITSFLFIAIIMLIADQISTRLLRKKIPGSAIAILLGLLLAYYGGMITGGEKGIADFPLFSGFKLVGGSMFRDFCIVSTALGVSFPVMIQAGKAGIISLILGLVLSFVVGVCVGLAFGYHDAESLATIGAGTLTFIVGPVTGSALGASSDVIALSVATGVVKAIVVTVLTPFVATKIKLDNPHAAMVFGGLIGTTSGVAAGLAATDQKLVPYGALTATFYTGLGCLLCPSIFYLALKAMI
ncbi:malonate transporter subunit MadM [Aquirufa ecclesiirivi]